MEICTAPSHSSERSAGQNYCRPFLKWAGGKGKVLDQIFAALPPGERLIEPFVGAGVVFLNAGFASNVLADSNPHLVATLANVQSRVDEVMTELESLFTPSNHCEPAYYTLRDEFNADPAPTPRHAALFIYLNRHCFNGLCRFNRSGGFNVPFGRYSNVSMPGEELLHFHAAARSATFTYAGFQETMAVAVPGDVIYADPPYVPLSNAAGFTSYDGKVFGEQEQRDLAEAAREAAAQGVPVVISNHDTPFTRKLYAGAALRFFSVGRTISCNGEKRGKAPELIAIFRPGT
jgi:DNA adenine methylase